MSNSAIAGVIPPVSCLVSNCAMPFTIQDAEELSLPIVLFSTKSVCSLLFGLHFQSLVNKGLIPVKGIGLISFFNKGHVLVLVFETQ